MPPVRDRVERAVVAFVDIGIYATRLLLVRLNRNVSARPSTG